MERCVVEHQMWSLLKLSRVTYSPNTVTNKKPALGGLERAQALRSLLIPLLHHSPYTIAPVSISDSHKTFQPTY
jgi:hypothetical protein